MKEDETPRDAAAGDSTQAGEGTAFAAVGALMGERRRYEGWIAALEARRTSTPDHVFARVHQDYTTRLDAVIEQLTSHADDLRRELDSLGTRLETLTAEQRKAGDERAEAELRAHVGELSADEWQRSAAVSDAALAELTSRRGDVEQELARTRELLESTARPSTSMSTTASANAPDVVAMPTEPVTAARARASRPAAAMQEERAEDAAMTEAVMPAELPASVIAAEQQLLDIDERPSRASVPVDAPPPAAPSADAAPSAKPRKSQGFDELAFLSSVVDTPAGTFEAAPADLPDEKVRRDSFARQSQEDAVVHLDGDTPPISSRAIEKEGEPLLSASSGNSALGRDSMVSDGTKSLKCSECGAMNYPTEWYCERCGAELASL